MVIVSIYKDLGNSPYAIVEEEATKIGFYLLSLMEQNADSPIILDFEGIRLLSPLFVMALLRPINNNGFDYSRIQLSEQTPKEIATIYEYACQTLADIPKKKVDDRRTKRVVFDLPHFQQLSGFELRYELQ